MSETTETKVETSQKIDVVIDVDEPRAVVPTPKAKDPKVKRFKIERKPEPWVQKELQNIDLLHRDPQMMNQNLRLQFGDVIAEPEPGTFSNDNVWIYSHKTFTYSKLWCYRILTWIFAIPTAFCCGIQFACLAYSSIWCCKPLIRAFKIGAKFLSEIISVIADILLRPVFGAIGHCLGSIQVVVRKAPESMVITTNGMGKINGKIPYQEDGFDDVVLA